MLTLLLIRHAESVGNQQGRMQGHGAYPLSAVGQRQATALAQRLWQEFEPPTQIYSSPLVRAKQTTAAVLQGRATVPLIYDSALAEGQLGCLSGLTWAEACNAYPDLCDRLGAQSDWVPIPGAESPQQGRHRADRWLAHIVQRHSQGDRLWMISHEWILYHLMSSLLGCDRTWQLPIAHTALFEFCLDLERWQMQSPTTRFNSTLWQIRRFNDTQHLGDIWK